MALLAIPAKCAAFLAVVLLFYTCCYAFRVRDHPAQPSASADHRRCDATVPDGCGEATPTPGPRWHTARIPIALRKTEPRITDRQPREKILAREEHLQGSAAASGSAEDEDAADVDAAEDISDIGESSRLESETDERHHTVKTKLDERPPAVVKSAGREDEREEVLETAPGKRVARDSKAERQEASDAPRRRAVSKAGDGAISGRSEPVAGIARNESKVQSKVASKGKEDDRGRDGSREPVAGNSTRDARTRDATRKTAAFTLSRFNDDLMSLPSFLPNFTDALDPACQLHGSIVLRQLRGYKIWAMQMLDASAKLPSGLLRGNLNQLGDFDECLSSEAHVKLNNKTIKVQGKYCLAQVDLHAQRAETKLPVHLMQGRNLIRGNLRDNGNFVPLYATINWGLCLPAACSSEDAERVLRQVLDEYGSVTGIKFTGQVHRDMCYVKEKPRSYSKETLAVLYLYATVVCLACAATARDYLVQPDGKGGYPERIFMSFSLRRTMRTLLKRDTGKGDIPCVNGLKALVTILVYVTHQVLSLSRLPRPNRVDFVETASTPFSIVLRVTALYTDTFLLLSAVLAAYNATNELKTRGEIRWFCRFVARYIRFTPALLVVIFWYAFVMEHTGSGPMWNSIVMTNADACKRNGWTNLLYIQNFFPCADMCAHHTHHLALDLQLSLLVPVLVFFLEYKPVLGLLSMAFLVLLCDTLRYIAMMKGHFITVLYNGMTVRNSQKTIELMYGLPWFRAIPYVFGVGLGVLLRNCNTNLRIHKAFVILGWSIATPMAVWPFYMSLNATRPDYVYDLEEQTSFSVVAPVLWATSISWCIFACHTNHAGLLNRLLSAYWLAVISRLSYTVYLTQFVVFFYIVGTARYPSEYQLQRSVDPLEIGTVVAASLVLTLLFDLPMQEAKNVIMECTDSRASPARETVTKTHHEKDNPPTTRDRQESIVNPGEDYPNDPVQSIAKSTTRRRSLVRQRGASSWEWITDPVNRSSSEEDESYIDRSLGIFKDYPPPEDYPGRGDAVTRSAKSSPLNSGDEKHGLKEKGRRKLREEEAEDYRSWELVARRQGSHPLSEDAGGYSDSEKDSARGRVDRRPGEEDWEQQLRTRRRQYLEKLTAQPDSLDEDFSSVRRRSSAEGKLALLRDPSSDDNMDNWTVSLGSRMAQLGSSQERSEAEDEVFSRRSEYRERAPPPREDSLEDSAEETWDDSVLTKDSRRRSLQDLSRLSREDLEEQSRSESLDPAKPTGLYKRESIVKSQASEEDPEFLLPERPKLVQQEREHPFKKAWQMQKSRSEEDYVIKDTREPRPGVKSTEALTEDTSASSGIDEAEMLRDEECSQETLNTDQTLDE